MYDTRNPDVSLEAIVLCRTPSIIGMVASPVMVRNGKGGKCRAVPMAPQLEAVLMPLACGDPKGYLLTDEQGKPMSYNALHLLFARLSDRTCLHVHAHKLRHTFATLLAKRGVSLFKIGSMLGHSNPAITSAYYASVAPDDCLQDVGQLPQLT